MARNEADVTIKLKAQDDASRTLDQTSKNMNKMGVSAQQMGIMAAAAFAAVGAGALALIDKSLKLNAQLEVTAFLTGQTGEEMRDLALDLSNVTFELDSVANSLTYLTRTQLVSNENLGATATAWDTMGDSAGMVGEKVMKLLIPAFVMFDKSIEKPMDTFDMFTNIINTSTTDLANLGRVISSSGQYINELGLDFEDLFLAIKGLAESGQMGKGIMSALSTGMSEATTSTKSFWEILGLNREELVHYLDEMDEWMGKTEELAVIQNKQYSLFDRMKQKLEDASFVAGSAFQSFEALFGIMTALSPIILIFAVNTTLASAAVHGLGVAIKIALGPVGWIIAALGLLYLAGTQIAKHWDKLAEMAKAVWNAIAGFITAVLKGIVTAFNAFKNTAIAIFEAIGKGILTYMIAPFWAVITLIEKIIEGIRKIPVIGTRIPGLGAMSDMIDSLQGWIGENTYLPTLDTGALVTRPTLALLAANNRPEAVVPLGSAGAGGYGTLEIPIYLGGREIDRYYIDLMAKSATVQGVRSRWT